MDYSVGQEIEVYYHGMWQNAVVRKVTALKSRNKKKIPRLFTVSSSEPNHEIHHVRECDIRLPMKYPTRKAVWALQFRHDTTQPWRIHWTGFRREVWNHTLKAILDMVKRHYKVFANEQERFRLYNYHTGETIPMAGLCD